MLRFVFFAAVALAVIALFTRSTRLRRGLWAVLVLMAAYAVLKLTGVIEAVAPDRDGMFW